MTRRERLERKIEKREEWADKAAARAAGRFETVHNTADRIPMGQPILVGHHSEGRHRRDAARIDNNMRKGIEEQNKAAHHVGKAVGLQQQLDNTIFSDDTDAVEKLQAKVQRLEASRDQLKSINKVVRRKPKNQLTPEKVTKLAELGLSEATARKLFEPDFGGRIGIPSYQLTNLGGNIRRARQRIEEVKARQVRDAKAEAAGGTLIEGTGDYVRVTFEEKPDREVLTALKAAGFRWGGGSWTGKRADLPEEVTEGTDED